MTSMNTGKIFSFFLRFYYTNTTSLVIYTYICLIPALYCSYTIVYTKNNLLPKSLFAQYGSCFRQSVHVVFLYDFEKFSSVSSPADLLRKDDFMNTYFIQLCMKLLQNNL